MQKKNPPKHLYRYMATIKKKTKKQINLAVQQVKYMDLYFRVILMHFCSHLFFKNKAFRHQGF